MPRILVRQIPSKSIYSINGVFVDTPIINDLNSMVIEDIHGISPLVLLGFINSKPMTLWFLMRFDKFQRRLFPQFKVKELEQFPIPKTNKQIQTNIEILVKSIIKKVKQGDSYTHENNRIDELVMTAFGLNDVEKAAVRRFEF